MRLWALALTFLFLGPAWAHEHEDVLPSIRPPLLEVEKMQKGWKRFPPQAIAPGILNENPSLVIDPDGRVVVAWVAFDSEGHREKILARRQKLHSTQEWEKPQEIFAGPIAWNPRLVKASNGSIWAVFEGDTDFHDRGDHSRAIYTRRIFPKLSPISRVSTDIGRNAFPAVSASPDQPEFLVAWESSTLEEGESHIAWARVSAEGKKAGQVITTFEGQSDSISRRPSVLALGGTRYALAWDRWMDQAPTKREDPNQDVFFAEVTDGALNPIQVTRSPGIDASPSLVVDSKKRIWLAYHSSQGHPLTKHTQLLVLERNDAKGGWKVQEAVLQNELALKESRGEFQGTEFPDLFFHPSLGVMWTSRPSQGFYLHRAEGKKVLSWDLTLGTWSARGIHASLAWDEKRSLLWIARRGAREALIESLQVPEGTIDGISFRPPKVETKKDLHWVQPEPVSVPDSSGRNVYFGDVHMHSAISDATGTPDEVLERAYVRGLDFAVLTDHDTVGGSRMFPSEYAEISWVTDLLDRRENFSTLHAYEWTTAALPKGSGHRNIYFQEYGPTEVYTSGNGHPNTVSLFQKLKSEKAFAVPHHTPWTGTDWENFDEKIQRLFEVVSVHGGADAADGPIANRGSMKGMFAIDGLKKGLHYGLIAGSDGHGLIYHHGVARHRNPWAQGLTGVLSASNERGILWQALYDRHSFGTSGPPLQAYLSSGEFGQGDEGSLEKNQVLLTVEVRGTTSLQQVVLFRNGKVWKRFSPAGKKVFQVKVRDVFQKSEWNEFQTVSYFVRATQKPVDAVWSSPIFLTRKKASVSSESSSEEP